MRKIWVASVVFLLGALLCTLQQRYQVALLLAMIGFELAYFADTRIDWRLRLTRKDWRQTLTHTRFPSTILASLAQVLAFTCLVAFFLVSPS
jgi:hypothetical protein